MPGDDTVSQRRLPGSAVAGVLIAFLAVSNLAQGAWSTFAGGLNLTVLSLPILAILLLVTPRKFGGGGFGHVIVFLVAVGVGFLSPAMNSHSTDLRGQVLVTVILPVALVSLAPQRWRVFKAFAVTVILMALVTAVLQFLNPAPDGLASFRRTPEGLSPINSGRILAAGALSCLVAVRWIRVARLKFLLILLGLVLLGCSALTGSRGSFMAVLIVGSLLLLLTQTLPMILRVGAWGAVAAPIYFLLSGGAETESRLVSTSDNGRGALARGAWNVFADHPLGVGWGNLYNYLESGAIVVQGEAQYPHNVLLEFAAEAGLIGAVLLIVCLAGSYRGLKYLRGSEEAVLFMALGGFALICALTSTNIVGNRLLWVCMAMGLGSMGLRSREGHELGVERQAKSTRSK